MNTKAKRAFTFLELLVVVAVFVIVLALVALPTLARSKTRSPAAGCLSNLRQLMTGWQMYADENGGRLMLNAPLGAGGTKYWCGPGATDWFVSSANTNKNVLLVGLMAPYVNSNTSIFRCPGDVLPSQNGWRVRSYSMNGQSGPINSSYAYGGPQNYSGLHTYGKEADITCPRPKDLFILCDESPNTLDDGYFQVGASAGSFPNLPACYLDNGCGFGFADGHAEIHKWQGSGLLIPVVQGAHSSTITISATDPDAIWFQGKAGCQ